MSLRVGIVALGAANRRSIEIALTRAGARACFVDDARTLAACDALVLPGVAHFGYVSGELDRTGLRGALIAATSGGVPLLAICVGFQLLFERSDEAPDARGLGIFAGRVRRLRTPRIPHMGWNLVEPSTSRIDAGYAYFANSYAPDADVPDAIATSTDGNDRFTCAAERDRVLGVQFHPERSGAYGARILRRFVRAATAAYVG